MLYVMDECGVLAPGFSHVGTRSGLSWVQVAAPCSERWKSGVPPLTLPQPVLLAHARRRCLQLNSWRTRATHVGYLAQL